jgi:dihydrofolate reductase
MAVLIIIAAIGRNRELGKDNDLLWHIAADLKRFKELTSGHTVIMGRRTFNSIRNKPLANRKNIVITRQKNFPGNGALVVSSPEEALEHTREDEEVFVLGGATIYAQFLSRTSKMYLTQVDAVYHADVYFPEFDEKEWQVIERTNITNDKQAGVNYSFINYRRI